ncbi:MAG: AbrB/MazE/SpoVT family DNA-binding domain-containing protein [Solirubrobacteraceae bacterium]
MARITSKRQVTIPKAIADRYGIASGDEIEFLPAGDAIRVERTGSESSGLDREQRLQRFDQATERQRARQKKRRPRTSNIRGWRRDELYERAGTR